MMQQQQPAPSKRKVVNRRPVQYWKPFNNWWRSQFELNGKRPLADDINVWYENHAEAAWIQEERPSLNETRIHAKCLRSVDEVRLYFRRYRAVKKQERLGGEECPSGQEDNEHLVDGLVDGLDLDPRPTKPPGKHHKPRARRNSNPTPGAGSQAAACSGQAALGAMGLVKRCSSATAGTSKPRSASSQRSKSRHSCDGDMLNECSPPLRSTQSMDMSHLTTKHLPSCNNPTMQGGAATIEGFIHDTSDAELEGYEDVYNEAARRSSASTTSLDSYYGHGGHHDPSDPSEAEWPNLLGDASVQVTIPGANSFKWNQHDMDMMDFMLAGPGPAHQHNSYLHAHPPPPPQARHPHQHHSNSGLPPHPRSQSQLQSHGSYPGTQHHPPPRPPPLQSYGSGPMPCSGPPPPGPSAPNRPLHRSSSAHGHPPLPPQHPSSHQRPPLAVKPEPSSHHYLQRPSSAMDHRPQSMEPAPQHHPSHHVNHHAQMQYPQAAPIKTEAGPPAGHNHYAQHPLRRHSMPSLNAACNPLDSDNFPFGPSHTHVHPLPSPRAATFQLHSSSNPPLEYGSESDLMWDDDPLAGELLDSAFPSLGSFGHAMMGQGSSWGRSFQQDLHLL